MGHIFSKFNTSKQDDLEVLNICLDTPNITKRRSKIQPRKKANTAYDALNPPLIQCATAIVSEDTNKG